MGASTATHRDELAQALREPRGLVAHAGHVLVEEVLDGDCDVALSELLLLTAAPAQPAHIHASTGVTTHFSLAEIIVLAGTAGAV